MDKEMKPEKSSVMLITNAISGAIWAIFFLAVSIGAMSWAVRFMYEQVILTWGAK